MHFKNIARHQNNPEQITSKVLWGTFSKVWKSDALRKVRIKEGFDKGELREDALHRLRDNTKVIIHNVNKLKDLIAEKHWMENNIDISVTDLIEELGGDPILKECYHDYYEKKPQSLYKYVKCEYALSSVYESHFRCGAAKEYGITDPRDGMALLDNDEEVDQEDFYGIVLGEVIFKIFEKKKFSIKEKKTTLNDIIGNIHYIGCLSDDPDSEYMWDTYGNKGVCIEFDTSGMNLHKVTYSDEPLSPKYVRKTLQTLSERIEYDSFELVEQQFLNLVKLTGSMGLLNLYRKDQDYQKEHEWRLLEKPDGLKAIKKNRFKGARIPGVVSSLPQKEDMALQEYCREHGIKYSRRVQ